MGAAAGAAVAARRIGVGAPTAAAGSLTRTLCSESVRGARGMPHPTVESRGGAWGGGDEGRVDDAYPRPEEPSSLGMEKAIPPNAAAFPSRQTYPLSPILYQPISGLVRLLQSHAVTRGGQTLWAKYHLQTLHDVIFTYRPLSPIPHTRTSPHPPRGLTSGILK